MYAYWWQHQHEDVVKSVEPNDIAFAMHGLILTAVQIAQCFLYKARAGLVATNSKSRAVCVYAGQVADAESLAHGRLRADVGRHPGHHAARVRLRATRFRLCLSFYCFCHR